LSPRRESRMKSAPRHSPPRRRTALRPRINRTGGAERGAGPASQASSEGGTDDDRGIGSFMAHSRCHRRVSGTGRAVSEDVWPRARREASAFCRIVIDDFGSFHSRCGGDVARLPALGREVDGRVGRLISIIVAILRVRDNSRRASDAENSLRALVPGCVRLGYGDGRSACRIIPRVHITTLRGNGDTLTCWEGRRVAPNAKSGSRRGAL